MLRDDAVASDIGQSRGDAMQLAIFLGHERIDVKPAKLRHNEIGIGGSLKLNGDIGFQPRDVGLLHRATKIDGDFAISFLKIDQSWKYPEITGSFGDRNANAAGCVVG